MQMRIAHDYENNEPVFIQVGTNCLSEGDKEPEITICNGNFHFQPLSNGECDVTPCKCRDRQEEMRRFLENDYHRRKLEFAYSFGEELDERDRQRELAEEAQLDPLDREDVVTAR